MRATQLLLLSLQLAAGVWLVASTTDDRGVARDSRLDLSLTELLALPMDDAESDDVDLRLQQAVAQCRLRGISSVIQSSFRVSAADSIDTQTGREGGGVEDEEQLHHDVAYCHRLRYVRHVRMRQRELWKTLDQPQKETATQAVQVVAAEDLDFQTFFETHAAVQVPAIGQPPADPTIDQSTFTVGLNSDELQQFMSDCFVPNQRVAPLLAKEETCKPLLDQFKVPLAAVNSYLPRTNASEASSLHASLLTFSESARSAPSPGQVTCPFGLHTLLVPLTNAVDYSVYDGEIMPYELPVGAAEGYNEVSVSAGSGATVPSSSVFGAFGGTRLVDAMAPLFSDKLSPFQTLFVPGGKYFATLSGSSRVMRFCYVDASNINDVTQSLRVDALVSGVAKSILLDLQSPAFDTSMVRRPDQDDTLWPNFLQWPKETKLRKRREMVSTDAAGDHAVPMSRRERLKHWHEDRRWVWHIQSLTLPVPLPPVVMNTTRHTATLRWQDLYERPKNDITVYGYEVRWKRETDVSSRSTTDTTGDANTGDLSGAVNFTHKHLSRSAMPTTLFGDDFDGKDIEGMISGLAADTLYSFSVRIFVGDTMGIESERSHSVRTAPCSVPDRVLGVVTALNCSDTCAQLRWLAPVDNGGRAITSYVFAMRPLRSPLVHLTFQDNPLQLSDEDRLVTITDGLEVHRARDSREVWLTANVCGQIPAQRVQIRVAAVNSIGVSAWSDTSATLTPRSEAEFSKSRIAPTIRGRGDPEYVSAIDLVAKDPIHSERPLPRVIVSDVYEKVVVAAPGATSESHLAVWRGHFSPRRFHVSSELVAADPLDAHEPLRNSADVQNRVVLISRGDVPLLTKVLHAQQAGALGVVLVDASDRCSRGFDQHCVAGSAKSQGRGFGWSDNHPHWQQITIPFVLAGPEDSRQLQELLGVV